MTMANNSNNYNNNNMYVQYSRLTETFRTLVYIGIIKDMT